MENWVLSLPKMNSSNVIFQSEILVQLFWNSAIKKLYQNVLQKGDQFLQNYSCESLPYVARKVN